MGLLIINVNQVLQLSLFCSCFLNVLSNCFQKFAFLQINIIFIKKILNKNYEWLKNYFKIFYRFICIQYLFLLLMH